MQCLWDVERPGLGSTHSGWWIGPRSWTVVVRRPARCDGYIQSEKWKTSRRPTSFSIGGRCARLHILRQTVDGGGRVMIRRSPLIPFQRIADPARVPRSGWREENELMLAVDDLSEPAQHPEHVVADAGTRVAQRRDVDDYSHNYTAPP